MVSTPEGNRIDKQQLAQLKQKLISTFDDQGRFTSIAEWETIAHFILNTDVVVGRALASHLVQTIETLKPAMPDAKDADMLVALSALAQFMNLGLVQGVEKAETEMFAAWETFASTVSYPEGNNRMGLDVDAGIQRIATAIAIEIIQKKIFRQVIDDYNK